jgi:hypothetical protein
MEPFPWFSDWFSENRPPASQILLLCRMAAANQVSFRVRLAGGCKHLLQSGQGVGYFPEKLFFEGVYMVVYIII